MNRKIQTATVLSGESVQFAGPGKYLKIIHIFPPALVTITTDNGGTNNAVAGTQIQFANSVKAGHFTCPGAAANIQVQFYIGDFPYIEVSAIEPGQTVITGDIITLPARGVLVNGKIFLVPGTITLNGTNFRRREIMMTNIDAGIDVYVEPSLSAFGTQAGNSDGLTLPHGGATPVRLQTDDTVTLINHDANNAVQVQLLQIWMAVIS